jgi:hypothetical protein
VASNYRESGLIVTSCAYPSTFWRTLLGNSTILWCLSSSRLVRSRSGHGHWPVIQRSSYQSSGCRQFPFCGRSQITARIKLEIAFGNWKIMQEKEYMLVFVVFWMWYFGCKLQVSFQELTRSAIVLGSITQMLHPDIFWKKKKQIVR